jgi:O-antigen/teichoic acid export membrane protein
MSPTIEPVFRAMSKVQDDLDQTKYLYYRSITLLMAYTTPFYVLLWWIAVPFIHFVYGDKWLAAAEPMQILTIAGVFLNTIYPGGALLAAQNKLRHEAVALLLNLFVTAGACVIGLNWGLKGVAWGIVLSNVELAIHFYFLARGTLRTRGIDLVRALTPGLALSTLLFAVLSVVHVTTFDLVTDAPLVYLLVMCLVGGLTYAAAFLLIPIRSLQTEAARWRQKLRASLDLFMGSRR